MSLPARRIFPPVLRTRERPVAAAPGTATMSAEPNRLGTRSGMYFRTDPKRRTGVLAPKAAIHSRWSGGVRSEGSRTPPGQRKPDQGIKPERKRPVAPGVAE
jgi:hypothetical protein